MLGDLNFADSQFFVQLLECVTNFFPMSQLIVLLLLERFGCKVTYQKIIGLRIFQDIYQNWNWIFFLHLMFWSINPANKIRLVQTKKCWTLTTYNIWILIKLTLIYNVKVTTLKSNVLIHSYIQNRLLLFFRK